MRISIGRRGFRNFLENEVDIHIFNWSKSNILVNNAALLNNRRLNSLSLANLIITLYEADIMYYLDQLAALHFFCI